MSQIYTEKAERALQHAKRSARELRQSYVGSEHILLGLLREGTGVAARVLMNNKLDEDQLVDLIRDLIAPGTNVAVADRDGFSPRAEGILEQSHQEAVRFLADKVGTEHILIALIKEGDSVATRLLNTLGVNIQRIYVDTLIAMGEDGNLYKQDFQNGRPMKKVAGATPTLDQYSRDLTALAKDGKLDPVIGRGDEITRVVQILSRRTKNNPCLVGEPGVGKTAIAEGLALKIIEGSVPKTIEGKRVVTLDLSGIVAGSKYRG